MSEILEGKLKIEDLARINSTSVSTPLPVISPRELACYKLARELSLGLQCFEGLDRIGHELAAETSNFSPSPDSLTDDEEQMTQSRWKEVNTRVLITRDADCK